MTNLIYEKSLSDSVKKIMYRVMKNAGAVQGGFLFFRHRFILKAHLDDEACDALLESMIINKVNVLRYLRRKYIPTWLKEGKGAKFVDQKCIQKVIIKEDKTLMIHIAKSEPHKIITDTFHVCNLLEEQGLEFKREIKFVIDQVQIAYQDTLLYNTLLREFGMKPPSQSLHYERILLGKYKKLENVAKIKKRSVKRKFLRWRVKRGDLIWQELRDLIAIDDFSPNNIKKQCDAVREAARARGVQVDF